MKNSSGHADNPADRHGDPDQVIKDGRKGIFQSVVVNEQHDKSQKAIPIRTRPNRNPRSWESDGIRMPDFYRNPLGCLPASARLAR